ncbi:TlpA family protein disulfide reductase [Aeromicrobium sp. CF3.5]|uniref:TlpA family protein disulfide reductase n=1 Tax=Aeromicrobium sp. CF3.5 TaxID=3373078 RepID=UPI003EE5AA98
MIGIVVLVVALLVTVVAAAWISRRNGRFTPAPAAPGSSASEPSERLTAETIGAPLGDVATLVQFSSAFCTPCRATRALLTDIAGRTDGVRTVEIDAESHLDLVRELNIMRTPTVLVLDADGVVTTRASGQPRREQVMAAIGSTAPDHSTI